MTRRLITLVLLILTTPLAQAGQLSYVLEKEIDQAGPDQMIPVWIKLHRIEPVASLKARSMAQAQTLAGRHQFVEQQLREGHQTAQADLADRLSAMRKQGSVKDVKQYWIINAIAAQVKASELQQLASRDDIEWIYPVVEPAAPELTPDATPYYSPEVDSITSNLVYVKANQAWSMGYTGAGRLICSFDTGVDGIHPALYSRWKGLDGDSAAAWFDPRDGETFPHAVSGYHGTHTMGIMVGDDQTIGYRTGVAPDAQWISAAVINVDGASVIDAFQWAADPDGNPNTADDVPDVINHSWGYSKAILACENLVFDLIDNTEALGIVNIFASGNRYQLNSLDVIVFNPANRDLTQIDCFAVGNLNTTVNPVVLYDGSGGSLGGPSDCNGNIKPNVVAPGRQIWSSVTGGSYFAATGTSMAAPHVSGLVALMREKNPNATPDEIKTAILNSTQTDVANWGALPNNNYGWGAIDCVAALNAIGDNLSDPTAIRLYDFTHAPITPGDVVTGTITLQNLGATVNNVTATITGTNPSLNVINGSVSFGTIPINSTVTSSGSVSVEVSDTVTIGSRIPINLAVNGDGFSTTLTLYFTVGDLPAKGIASHQNGTIQFSVGNYGVLGLGPNSLYRAGGLGFTYNSTINDLWEGGVIIGTGPTKISSGVHSYFDRPDMDFKVIPGGDMAFVEPGRSGAQESISAFNDDWATDPIGVTIRQHSFSYDYPNDDFIIVRYVLENFSGQAINGLYFGLMLDWDISGSSDAGGYDNPNGILWQAYNNGSSLTKFRGMKTIQGTPSGALTQSAVAVSFIKLWLATANGFTDAEKWTSLNAGIPVSDIYEADTLDLFQMMNFGPFNLADGGIDSVTIAILAGNSLLDLQTAASAAMLVPTDVNDDNGPETLPTTFTLKQNYPNPFNPTTSIEFDLPEPAEYELTIFNVLGQTVYSKKAHGRAGTVQLNWDAGENPSGVYFYRVKTDQFTASRKMILLK